MTSVAPGLAGFAVLSNDWLTLIDGDCDTGGVKRLSLARPGDKICVERQTRGGDCHPWTLTYEEREPNHNRRAIQRSRGAPKGVGLRVEGHRVRVEDLFEGQFEEGDIFVVASRIAHVNGELLLEGTRTQDLGDVLEFRIGLTFESGCFLFGCIDLNSTEGIGLSARLSRALIKRERERVVRRQDFRARSYRQIGAPIDEANEQRLGQFVLFEFRTVFSFHLNTNVRERISRKRSARTYDV